ncbi:unnamed protein product [Nezara viridula]|uniref:Uncharacterized protein n=1 Tax=Nezara viridula TaxID=85310 RepID=A0A9P0MXT2_NEZVI|nr:unnamed protein product [Nezara viridula]
MRAPWQQKHYSSSLSQSCRPHGFWKFINCLIGFRHRGVTEYFERSPPPKQHSLPKPATPAPPWSHSPTAENPRVYQTTPAPAPPAPTSPITYQPSPHTSPPIQHLCTTTTTPPTATPPHTHPPPQSPPSTLHQPCHDTPAITPHPPPNNAPHHHPPPTPYTPYNTPYPTDIQ